MTKLLNLDAMMPEETREVQMGGKVYPIKEMTVQDFMMMTQLAEKLQATTRVQDHVNHTIELITQVCPGMPKDELHALSITKLSALAKFIRGDEPEEIKKAAEAGN